MPVTRAEWSSHSSSQVHRTPQCRVHHQTTWWTTDATCSCACTQALRTSQRWREQQSIHSKGNIRWCIFLPNASSFSSRLVSISFSVPHSFILVDRQPTSAQKASSYPFIFTRSTSCEWSALHFVLSSFSWELCCHIHFTLPYTRKGDCDRSTLMNKQTARSYRWRWRSPLVQRHLTHATIDMQLILRTFVRLVFVCSQRSLSFAVYSHRAPWADLNLSNN